MCASGWRICTRGRCWRQRCLPLSCPQLAAVPWPALAMQPPSLWTCSPLAPLCLGPNARVRPVPLLQMMLCKTPWVCKRPTPLECGKHLLPCIIESLHSCPYVNILMADARVRSLHVALPGPCARDRAGWNSAQHVMGGRLCLLPC